MNRPLGGRTLTTRFSAETAETVADTLLHSDDTRLFALCTGYVCGTVLCTQAVINQSMFIICIIASDRLYCLCNKSSDVAEMAAQCCIFAFEWGYFSLTQSFSVISREYHCKSYIAEN